MARQKDQISVYQGRYHRTLGKALNGRGELAFKKFLLGTDRAAAEVANRLLEQLWAEVLAEHDEALRFQREMGGRLGDTNLIEGIIDHNRLRRLDHGPVWRAESLLIAEAVRRGRREILVAAGDDVERPQAYVERVTALRRRYSVIAFTPELSELYALGQKCLAVEAKDLVEQAQDLSAKAQASLPIVTGQTLYQALDAYGEYIKKHNRKEFGIKEAETAARLKAAHPDMGLEQFGISSLERIAAYWVARPNGKRTGKPVALRTVVNQLKTTRRFIRWLHRSDAFQWSKPVDAEDTLRVSSDRLRTDEEIAKLGRGVDVYTVAELTTLYRYATDRERVLILLALNCGFAHAEICSLRKDEIDHSTQPVVIRRIRRKSHVPGLFSLWPQTVRGLDWFQAQDTATGAAHEAYAMLTEQGHLLDRMRIANMWNRLLRRVCKDQPRFRRLSFKYLRKTAGQLVRDRSDGEVSGVFLCHGQAVASDDLADVYTRRPFAKVMQALRQVHEDLLPMFGAAPEAFTKPRARGSPNISRGTIDRIRELSAQGVTRAAIAEQLGISRQTVRRWTNQKRPSTAEAAFARPSKVQESLAPISSTEGRG